MTAGVTRWEHRFETYFDPAVVSRGRAYARDGAVDVLAGDDRGVSARVRGSETYEVMVQVERQGRSARLVGSCECPFAEKDLCKHVWATLLVASEKGFLAEARNAKGIVGEWLEPSGEIDDPFDDDGYEEPARPVPPPRRAPRLTWRDVLAHATTQRLPVPPVLDRRHRTERSFVLDLERSRTDARGLRVEVRERTVGPGQQGAWKRAVLDRAEHDADMDPRERALLRLLATVDRASTYYDPTGFTAPFAIAWENVVVPLGELGSCVARTSEGEGALVVDRGPPYQLWLVVREADARGKALTLTGELRRGDERLPLSALSVIFDAGFAFVGPRAVRVASSASFPWVAALRQAGEIAAPAGETDELLRALVQTCGKGSLELPASISTDESPRRMSTRVHVRTPERSRWQVATPPLEADISFDYGGGARTGFREPGDWLFSPEERRLVRRDREGELAALAALADVGFRVTGARGQEGTLTVAASRLTDAILALPPDRFVVEADGVIQRRASRASFSVTSGIDWFDLEAHMEFDGVAASVPALLEAARRNQQVVRLDDGSVGLLPDAWIARLRRLIGLSTENANVKGGVPLRFGRAQVAVVEAMLGHEREAIAWDGPIRTLRAELATLDRLKPARAPRGFVGELRPYQREGLAWLKWLESVGLSGCLADDMGLGKTVQVLALLAGKRAEKKTERRPSLVVAPRSVVFNWLDEARRFTPGLRVIELAPSMTSEDVARSGADLVVTTYGLLRHRIETLAKIDFDYVILDEAHAIKNPSAATTTAARLLRATHRLALTGTPVENHLGELGSLFDFLMPGLLGHSFRSSSKRSFELDAEAATRLGRGLRPFLLRRKKSDVLTELPPRIEQTIHCAMQPAQRAVYEQVRDHYRASLLARVRRDGVGRSAVHVLEALLRLRQIACHPGLVDRDRRSDASAKLEALFEHLEPIVAQGKKALVFSQFTSLLDIVQAELVERKMAFERLDGTTRDRKDRVARFQSDASCSVFLVSLKAGGLGLNLTAAEYVFLLDPWWNPAAESQAIDRAHRMGQTRTVVSYRVLCKDTVEDRVAQLQERKRALVASVFAESKTRLGDLSIEDVEALLS